MAKVYHMIFLVWWAPTSRMIYFMAFETTLIIVLAFHTQGMLKVSLALGLSLAGWMLNAHGSFYACSLAGRD